MDRQSGTGLWMMRGAYLGLAMVIIFFHLLPLDTVPRNWAPPDLLLAFTFAWAVRRPEYVPVFAIALAVLMADLMFQRPPGVLALLTVLGIEYVKNRSAGIAEAGFAGEWFTVSLVLTAIVILNRIILAVFVVHQAPLGLSAFQLIGTIVAYPIVILVTQILMGVRRPLPGDGDAKRVRA